jgi:hypothetical protein
MEDFSEFFKSLGEAPLEPTAEEREFAVTMRRIFNSLVAAGFTESQALKVISETMAGIIVSQMP